MIENYRSKNNLVEFANQFAECIEHRIKENNVRSVEKLNGKIKIVQYSSNHLIYPLVKTIINADLSGSTCILTRTNDEALYITGLLNKFKVNAKLIQSNDGFNLSNLQEIRFIKDFLSSNKDSRVIPEEKLDEVRGEIKERFNGCHALPICLQILKTFERTYPKTKYKSDFDVFVGESMIEDFIDEGNDTILVSTMHKAKGKEFENVFILLNQYDLSDDAARRLLYVAITRAKTNLAIHYNGSFLEHIEVENLKKIVNENEYSSPEQIYLQLTHQDMNLGYFKYVQHRIGKLKSGNQLLKFRTCFQCT